jgi:hypothetical protein
MASRFTLSRGKGRVVVCRLRLTAVEIVTLLVVAAAVSMRVFDELAF